LNLSSTKPALDGDYGRVGAAEAIAILGEEPTPIVPLRGVGRARRKDGGGRWMELGKLLILLGVTLIVVGAVVVLLGRMHLPLGRLPGDFLYRGKNTTVYFPLATSVVVSVALTILLYLIGRWRR
jgi:hypothetical protein